MVPFTSLSDPVFYITLPLLQTPRGRASAIQMPQRPYFTKTEAITTTTPGSERDRPAAGAPWRSTAAQRDSHPFPGIAVRCVGAPSRLQRPVMTAKAGRRRKRARGASPARRHQGARATLVEATSKVHSCGGPSDLLGPTYEDGQEHCGPMGPAARARRRERFAARALRAPASLCSMTCRRHELLQTRWSPSSWTSQPLTAFR